MARTSASPSHLRRGAANGQNRRKITRNLTPSWWRSRPVLCRDGLDGIRLGRRVGDSSDLGATWPPRPSLAFSESSAICRALVLDEFEGVSLPTGCSSLPSEGTSTPFDDGPSTRGLPTTFAGAAEAPELGNSARVSLKGAGPVASELLR